jgi:hypothetical protein
VRHLDCCCNCWSRWFTVCLQWPRRRCARLIGAKMVNKAAHATTRAAHVASKLKKKAEDRKAGGNASPSRSDRKVTIEEPHRARMESPTSDRARMESPRGDVMPVTAGSSEAMAVAPGYRIETRIIDPAFKKKVVKEPDSFEALMHSVTNGGEASKSRSSLTDPNRRRSSVGLAAAFSSAGDGDATTVFRRQSNELRERLRKANRGLLNPTSPRMQAWDMVTLGLLFYTATITPYEVCFMWADTKRDALWIVNWGVNLLFITVRPTRRTHP